MFAIYYLLLAVPFCGKLYFASRSFSVIFA